MSEVAVKNIVEALPYKIKDIGLSKDGRNAIEISEKEMPGLMATRAKSVSYTHLTLPTTPYV